MEIKCYDEKMKLILMHMGVAENDKEASELLKNSTKRKKMNSVIEMQGGLDKVYEVTKRKLSISGPVAGSFVKNTGFSDPFRIVEITR